jgi:branched-chain amino acid transport system ATP-binding protein
MEILKLDSIYKDFGGLAVLFGVSMQVEEGERRAIIGPNGAGKSTLFNIITGLYKPTKGHIFFRDRDITGKPIHRLARMGLSRSFQIINIFPAMTVFRNVRSAVVSRFNRRFNWASLLDRSKQITEETDRVISMAGLSDSRDILASELAYGQQRQLELALTLARDPVIILLDEPTAGLNADDTRGFVKLIKEVTAGKTLVMVEHDMEVVFDLADRITVLNYGEILATGTPKEIRESEEVQKAYLGRGEK